MRSMVLLGSKMRTGKDTPTMPPPDDKAVAIFFIISDIRPLNLPKTTLSTTLSSPPVVTYSPVKREAEVEYVFPGRELPMQIGGGHLGSTFSLIYPI